MSAIAPSVRLESADQQPSGWEAQLNCTFQKGPERTIVRRNHVGPLSIQRPYYPEAETAHVYMLHPPGGVVAGDTLAVNIQCESGSAALMSTPGATKFYRSESRPAIVEQTINSSQASLEWLPQENIFFNGCNAGIKTNIVIDEQSSLAWWEINCFGRNSGNAPFSKGTVQNSLQLHVNSTLVLKERLLVNEQHNIQAYTGLRGFSVSGMLLLTPLPAETISFARNRLNGLAGFSTTCFDNILMVRYLGNSSEEAKNGFITIWSGLRSILNGNEPHMPRIWST